MFQSHHIAYHVLSIASKGHNRVTKPIYFIKNLKMEKEIAFFTPVSVTKGKVTKKYIILEENY